MNDSFQARASDTPFTRGADPRVGRLSGRVGAFDPLRQSAERAAADPTRASQLYAAVFGRPGHVITGLVVNALPTLDWYRVQTPENGFLACRRGRPDGPPLGPRETGALAPGLLVLVHLFEGSQVGIILAALPPPDYAGLMKGVQPPVAYGGPTGLLVEPFLRFLPEEAYARGGVSDYGIGRPPDETCYDRGVLAETGVGYGANSFQAFLRAGPFAMIRAGLYPQSLSVRGYLLKLFSGAHLLDAGDDEGETYVYEGVAAYPWEARGRYEPGAYGRRYTDAERRAQPVAGWDLDESARAAEPFHRAFAYGGYLGQGGYEAVVAPAPGAGGFRLRAAAGDGDVGLYRAAVTRQGGLTVVSAHSTHVGRRVVIPTPRRRCEPFDPAGDDAAAGNYKASNQYGDGPDHRVEDPAPADGVDAPAFLPVAGVQDFVARELEKTGYPFVRHAGDFHYPREGAQRPFEAATAPLDAAAAAAGGAVRPPPPVHVAIDSVYGETAYYAAESGTTNLPDGSLVQRGSGGSSVVCAGGKVFIDAPAGIEIRSGGAVLVLGEQVAVRAKRSVDLSATTNDVRIKAERHVQVLAGAGGTGGLLLEGRGAGRTQLYKGRVGEEVGASGVVVKSAGIFAALADEAYVRTLRDNITLDAQKGDADVVVAGRSVTAFAREPFRIVYGPAGDRSEATGAYVFAPEQLQLPGALVAKGPVYSVGEEGGLFVKGGVYATGSVVCGGSVADREGGFVGKVDSTFVPELGKGLALIARGLGEQLKALAAYHAAAVVARFYRDGTPGADGVVRDLAFSFRDDPNAAQYGTAAYETFEPHWQMLAEVGVLAGVSPAPWKESPVNYQGRDTYPWPGAAAWAGRATSVRYVPVAVDPVTGNAARDAPPVSRWTTRPPDGTFATIR